MKPRLIDLQPTLNGDLLSLRPLRSDDFEALFACASDPLIWEQHPQSDRFKRDVFFFFFDSAIRSGGALIAVDNKTRDIIGSSRFYNLQMEQRLVVIGYTFLTRKYWGGLYNREMKRMMLSHAFEFLDTVQFEIGASNLRSRRAIEKIGAQFLKKQMFDGRAHCVYRIDKKAFAKVFA